MATAASRKLMMPISTLVAMDLNLNEPNGGIVGGKPRSKSGSACDPARLNPRPQGCMEPVSILQRTGLRASPDDRGRERGAILWGDVSNIGRPGGSNYSSIVATYMAHPIGWFLDDGRTR